MCLWLIFYHLGRLTQGKKQYGFCQRTLPNFSLGVHTVVLNLQVILSYFLPNGVHVGSNCSDWHVALWLSQYLLLWDCLLILGLLLFSHSVISDSLRPHGLWPTRLLCPWDSPGRNTGVGSHCLLWRIFPTWGIKPRSAPLAGRFFTTEACWKPSPFSGLAKSFLKNFS